MADGSDPVFATLRFAAFAALAILGPGIALQRLARVRVDPALVVPSGLLFCAGAYWLSLVTGWPLVFPALVAAVLVPLLRTRLRVELAAERPSLRGALPAVLALLAVLAATEFRANRVDGDGAFRLDVGEHVDTAVHVGVTWELVASYPPQVPGLAGVADALPRREPSRARRGRALGRDPPVRRDQPLRRSSLWGVALVFALRAAAHALGLGVRAVRFAGSLSLAADLSFVPGCSSARRTPR